MVTKHSPFLIADTSGLLSLANPADRNHAAAKDSAEHLPNGVEAILIPYEVFCETVNVAGRQLGHAFAATLAEQLTTTDLFAVYDTSDDVREKALESFVLLPESVSYTDCIVMAFADAYRSKAIFGFDRAFAQSGYRIIDQEVERSAA